MRNPIRLILCSAICCVGLASCGTSPESTGDAAAPVSDVAGNDHSPTTGTGSDLDVKGPTPEDDVNNSSGDVAAESPSDASATDGGPAISDVAATDKGVTVMGSGFSAQSGRTVNVAVADDKGSVLARMSAMVTAGGTFEVVVPATLTAGHSYNVAYDVDANGNGFCNVPPLDVSGVVPLAATAAGAQVSVLANSAAVPVCSYFGDFSYNFDSQMGLVEGHPGHNAYGVIADKADNTIVGELKYGLVDSKGELVLKWPTILVKGRRYVFVLWTDDNGDGVCGTDKKFIYQAAAHPGADPTNDSALDVTAVPVTADINETFPYHHETAQNGANFCQQYFPNSHYP